MGKTVKGFDCKKCGSKNTYVLQDKTIVCRKCGNKEKQLTFTK